MSVLTRGYQYFSRVYFFALIIGVSHNQKFQGLFSNSFKVETSLEISVLDKWGRFEAKQNIQLEKLNFIGHARYSTYRWQRRKWKLSALRLNQAAFAGLGHKKGADVGVSPHLQSLWVPSDSRELQRSWVLRQIFVEKWMRSRWDLIVLMIRGKTTLEKSHMNLEACIYFHFSTGRKYLYTVACPDTTAFIKSSACPKLLSHFYYKPTTIHDSRIAYKFFDFVTKKCYLWILLICQNKWVTGMTMRNMV